MIRVITFDLDDTLWELSPVLTLANQKLYQWLSAQAPEFSQRYRLEDFEILRRQVVKAHPELAHSVTAIRLGVLRLGLSACGYRGKELEQLAENAFTHFLEARNQVEFFQHTLATLRRLKQNYQIGALSNGNADIEMVGLGDYFDFCFNADLVGTAKPHPLMFEQMLEYTGVQACEVIHIGDHPIYDIQGAHQVGLHTLWANFDNSSWNPEHDFQPTIEVNCLSEIPAKIDALSAQLAKQAKTTNNH